MKRVSGSRPKSALSKHLKIGVIYGGTSSERSISCRSGKGIRDALIRCGFNVLSLDPKLRAQFSERLKRIDVAFIALHGAGGEDGSIQAHLEKKKIAYVGSTPRGCRLSFDKEVAKKRLRAHCIPTPDSFIIQRADWKKRLERFNRNVFIKPCDEGSSIGAFTVSRGKNPDGRIRKAIKKYKRLLVEERIEGREFTVGILGEKVLPVIELVTQRGFYDYRSKYTKGLTRYKVPAPINAVLIKRLKGLALKTHRVLELRDMSRVDIMVSKQGKPFVLEANTIPGFTELSLLPMAARKSGISYDALCEKLVGYAYKRINHTRRRGRN